MNEKLTDLYRKLSLITHTIESAEDCYVNFQILEETIDAKMKIAEISNLSLNTFKFACLYQAIMNLSKVFADRNRILIQFLSCLMSLLNIKTNSTIQI